ncbi:prenyltransferase [Thiobacter aerophilum]|uniref:Prenyltransferase n=1 Tax=Thiobacter aerophilum TaxID=3121275 RepID=A0ABV0EIT2_9BURK
MAAREPTLAALPNPFLRYFLATRPAFLTITLVGALLGIACVVHDGITLKPLLVFVTLFAALVTHAGMNVLNDYYDALSGCDARNVDRIYPYTGGSRFIQNGVLTLRATAAFGFALLIAVIPAGLWLAWHAGPGLLAIGAFGLFLGWAYSADPLRLNGRGLGELCVALGYLLVVVGSDFVERPGFATLPWVAGTPYALLVTAILYVNQFPDRAADAASGKRHWVVRLSPSVAARGYGVFLLLAYAGLLTGIALRGLPVAAAAALAALPLSLRAWSHLVRHADTPRALAPAIRDTLGAAHLAGLLIAAALIISKGPT